MRLCLSLALPVIFVGEHKERDMHSQHRWTADHYRIWAATRTGTQGTHPVLGTDAERSQAWWPRFAATYEQLRALPRRVRRAVQRQWACSLAGVALVFTLGITPTEAATINVSGGCTLINAITSANTETSVGGCTAGSGADTIVLPAASTQNLTAAIPSAVGDNGLPLITSTITIQGNGSTIARTGGPDFRILAVGPTGNLTLDDLR